VDEDTAVVAAWIARELKLPHNHVSAAEAAKDKRLMRDLLSRAAVPVPRYRHFALDEDAAQVAAVVDYPCVVKPVFLSTSRGVMRADNPDQFNHAVERLRAILARPEVVARGGMKARDVLVEEFVPGLEVALEGLVTDGRLTVLAIFDKPDPLDGPFFEETIYVTPSRLPADVQTRIEDVTQDAVRAMGLTRGPIHAELRINDRGPWVIEVAARAIGGLCSRTLRFVGGNGDDADRMSLEELIVRHALSEDVSSFKRESRSAGVMMIPIPASGILREVRGLETARSVSNVEDVVISAHIGQAIAPPPGGSSYLGFIFSRADSAARAESALREAHSELEFAISCK
jgi:biotin carboxylase